MLGHEPKAHHVLIEPLDTFTCEYARQDRQSFQLFKRPAQIAHKKADPRAVMTLPHHIEGVASPKWVTEARHSSTRSNGTLRFLLLKKYAPRSERAQS